MSQLPRNVLKGVGLACIAFAGLGLWYNGATMRARFGPQPSEPYFLQAFYGMSAFCICCYLGLFATGIQLVRLKTRWVRLLSVVVVFEVLFFFTVAAVWIHPSLGLSVAAATGVATGGLMFQFGTLFFIWGPLLAHWASRRIECPGGVADPFAAQERIARSTDWLWAGINAVVLSGVASIALSMLWVELFPGTPAPGYLPAVALGIGLANGFASVRLRRKRRQKKIARRQQDRLAHGLCPRCEYSLAGNISGTCPECGQPVQLPAPSP